MIRSVHASVTLRQPRHRAVAVIRDPPLQRRAGAHLDSDHRQDAPGHPRFAVKLARPELPLSAPSTLCANTPMRGACGVWLDCSRSWLIRIPGLSMSGDRSPAERGAHGEFIAVRDQAVRRGILAVGVVLTLTLLAATLCAAGADSLWLLGSGRAFPRAVRGAGACRVRPAARRASTRVGFARLGGGCQQMACRRPLRWSHIP